jgi:hypothetical protein
VEGYRWLKLIHCTGNAIGIVRCRQNREIDGIHEIVVVERILVDLVLKKLRSLSQVRVALCVSDGRD